MDLLFKAAPYLSSAMTAGKNLTAYVCGFLFATLYIAILSDGAVSMSQHIATHLIATVVLGCGVHFLQVRDARGEEVDASRKSMEDVIVEAGRLYRDSLD